MLDTTLPIEAEVTDAMSNPVRISGGDGSGGIEYPEGSPMGLGPIGFFIIGILAVIGLSGIVRRFRR
ncbi:MAG: hypothetical protein OXR64_12720 [Chloroflexota bacterium]|nr:hypothetical protein [Chloroflexota bacterium]MDE2920690.1 hypothetical protein [Chloroflexota bacterium]